MQKIFPIMMDRPEKGSSFAAFFYGVVCFFSFPFLILLFMHELIGDPMVMSWFEIGYHLFNLFVMVSLYRSYLSDSVFDLQVNWKKIAETVGICAVIIFGLYFAILQLLPLFSSVEMTLLLEGMLPMSEMELFWLNSAVVYFYPLFGTLCMVLVTPVVMSCIYYASAFAPICCEHPWLAYPATALVLALPRIANAVTFWNPGDQVILYFAQLPIHMIACWAYQRTDNIWTPVVLHMVVNLASCLLFLYLTHFVWI